MTAKPKRKVADGPLSKGSEKVDPRSKGWIKPGQVLNPKGRPKGSRNALGEAFVKAMHDDFKANGNAAIVTVREERPHDYLKVIATIIPKEITHDAADPIAALFNQLNQPVFPGDGFEPDDEDED
tara:strand:+ start:527 stop:901 length:375 start_codon:yes stop_codon:yes gene_type:complete